MPQHRRSGNGLVTSQSRHRWSDPRAGLSGRQIQIRGTHRQAKMPQRRRSWNGLVTSQSRLRWSDPRAGPSCRQIQLRGTHRQAGMPQRRRSWNGLATCDPCHVSIYSPRDRREITNTHSESPKEEFRVMELPQSGKIQPRIIDPVYPPITQSRSRLDSSHPGSKRLSLPSGLHRAALSICGDGATPK